MNRHLMANVFFFTFKSTLDMAQTQIGTPNCLAPEVWQNKKYNKNGEILETV